MLGTALAFFPTYVYTRIGVNRNAVLIFLWSMPAAASFIVAMKAKAAPLLQGLSFVIVVTILGPLSHLFADYFGATVDLGGLEGLRATVPIFFVMSVITVGAGAVAGMLFRKDG